MTKPDFYGPRLKLERAEEHLKELQTVLWDYISENVQRMTPQRENDALTRAFGRGVIGAGFPKRTATVLGDAVHNMRTPLDHAYCVLIESNGGKPLRHSAFPFGAKDWQSIEATINGHKNLGAAPSAKVIGYIRDEVQPYPGGKLALHELHLLDVADKHAMLLRTKVQFDVNNLWTIPEPGARPILMHGITFEGDLSRHPHFGFIDLGGGSVVHSDNSHLSFRINFGKGQPFEGQTILPTLYGLVATIRKVLDDLERL